MSHTGVPNDTSIEQSFFQYNESPLSMDRMVKNVPIQLFDT